MVEPSSSGNWFSRLSTPWKVVVAGIAISAVLIIRLTDLVNSLPIQVVALAVTLLGVSGLVLASNPRWSREGKAAQPVNLVGLVMRPLPFAVWRVLMALLSRHRLPWGGRPYGLVGLKCSVRPAPPQRLVTRPRRTEVPLSGALAAGHGSGRRARSPLAIT